MAILTTLFRPFLRPWLLILCLFLTACSRPFFYPDQHIRLTPDKLGLHYHDINLKAKDGTLLHAWQLLPKTQAKGIVLVLHGNAENISTHIHSIAWLAESGYELLLLDYRGYGLSQGRPSLPNILQDIDAAAHWLSDRIQSQQLPGYWLGQSIGASLSTYYLARHKVEGLRAVVLDSPFSSYRQISREKFSEFWLTWPVQYPLSWLVDNRYSPDKAVPEWPDLPLLVFSSSKDKVIPNHHTQQLLDHFSGQAKEKIEYLDTQSPHIGTFNHATYRQITLEFLNKSKNVDSP
ncbi:MAG: alpha/beta fold hydrolase [Porticoccus sp.]|nr:alpha/beta fold hydrolase [Porticoccus sp.]